MTVLWLTEISKTSCWLRLRRIYQVSEFEKAMNALQLIKTLKTNCWLRLRRMSIWSVWKI